MTRGIVTLGLRSAVVTDIGPRRTRNEDAAFAGRRLLVIADGMGGMPAGDMASDLAIQALLPLEHTPDPHLTGVLRQRVAVASESIRDAAAGAADRTGMGTTLTALLASTSGDRCAIAHIGDSRCYLFRDSVLTRITRDDSYVQILIEQGGLTEEEARLHPQRSFITHAVQGQSIGPSSVGIWHLQANDRFMLCSDGLTDVISDEVIAAVIGDHASPTECAQELVRHALEARTSDNVTVIVADVRPPDDAAFDDAASDHAAFDDAASDHVTFDPVTSDNSMSNGGQRWIVDKGLGL